MSRVEYFLHIGVAATAAELHEITRSAATDPALTPADCIAVRGEVGKRFSNLNGAALAQSAPSWRTPVRIPTPERCR